MVLLVPAERPPVSWRYRWQSFCCWCNREPQLTVRRVVWIVTAGWALFVFYGAAAIFMATSLIFIPFVLPALQLAWFVLDPVGKQAVPHDRFNHTFCIAANLVWLFFFGWELTLLLLAAAIVQLFTIIGVPTALNFLEFAKFTLWPFGKDITPKYLPTSVAQMRSDVGGRHMPNVRMASHGSQKPLSGQGAPMGDNAV